MRMPGFSSCWYWNGGELKCAVISEAPDSSATCASGCDSETVSASSFPCWPSPKAFSAAICSVTAWIDTLTAGSAILSFSVKSLIVLTFGLRVLR